MGGGTRGGFGDCAVVFVGCRLSVLFRQAWLSRNVQPDALRGWPPAGKRLVLFAWLQYIVPLAMGFALGPFMGSPNRAAWVNSVGVYRTTPELTLMSLVMASLDKFELSFASRPENYIEMATIGGLAPDCRGRNHMYYMSSAPPQLLLFKHVFNQTNTGGLGPTTVAHNRNTNGPDHEDENTA